MAINNVSSKINVGRLEKFKNGLKKAGRVMRGVGVLMLVPAAATLAIPAGAALGVVEYVPRGMSPHNYKRYDTGVPGYIHYKVEDATSCHTLAGLSGGIAGFFIGITGGSVALAVMTVDDIIEHAVDDIKS